MVLRPIPTAGDIVSLTGGHWMRTYKKRGDGDKRDDDTFLVDIFALIIEVIPLRAEIAIGQSNTDWQGHRQDFYYEIIILINNRLYVMNINRGKCDNLNVRVLSSLK
jgi:hypothetical protein